MKKNFLKKIGRIFLLAPILYTLNTKELIAPEFKSLLIEYSEPIIKDIRKVIVLDPGHGMDNRIPGLMDWGLIYKDYKEAEIVLEKIKNIKKMLDSSKYKVILTREDNLSPCPIESRAKIANKNNAYIFMSFHLNDYKGLKEIRGSEVYYRKENNKELKNKSKKLGRLAAKNLEYIANIPNRCVMQEDYLMLKDVECPAILIEIGYLLNENDKKKILEENLVEKAAIKTIEDYLK